MHVGGRPDDEELDVRGQQGAKATKLARDLAVARGCMQAEDDDVRIEEFERFGDVLRRHTRSDVRDPPPVGGGRGGNDEGVELRGMVTQCGDDDITRRQRRGSGRDDVIEHATQHGVREVSVRPAQRAVEQLHAESIDQWDDDGIEEIVGRKGDDGAAQEEVERDGVEARDRTDARLEEITRRGRRRRRRVGRPRRGDGCSAGAFSSRRSTTAAVGRAATCPMVRPVRVACTRRRRRSMSASEYRRRPLVERTGVTTA